MTSSKAAIQQAPVDPCRDDLLVVTPLLPQALTVDGIKELIESFRQGARRALEAGFDVIEIHTAHGYLLSEFLSPKANKRSDAYGATTRTAI